VDTQTEEKILGQLRGVMPADNHFDRSPYFHCEGRGSDRGDRRTAESSSGTHDELMARRRILRDLYQKQFRKKSSKGMSNIHEEEALGKAYDSRPDESAYWTTCGHTGGV